MTEKTKEILIIILLALAVVSLLCAAAFGVLTSINPQIYKQIALTLMYIAISGLSLSVPLFVAVALFQPKKKPAKSVNQQDSGASYLECYFCGYHNPTSSVRCANCGKKLE